MTSHIATGPLSPCMHAAQKPAAGGSVNVGREERLVSTIVGGGLALFGISRGSLLGLLLTAAGGGLLYRGLTGHCGLYASLGLNSTVHHHAQVGVRAQHGFKLQQSITINRPRHELYAFWRKFDNLPRDT